MDEKIINVKGKEYFLIPTFENLKNIEIRLNEKFMAIGHRLIRQDYGIEDVVTMLYCLIDKSEKVNYKSFADDIFEEGFNKYLPVIIDIFAEITQRGTEDVNPENPPSR